PRGGSSGLPPRHRMARAHPAFPTRRSSDLGLYIFDEPESALSPARQIEFLKLMRRMDEAGHCQVLMATHSPVLMAYPGATLLRRSEEHTSELQSHLNLVCRLLLEKKKTNEQ